MKTLQALIYRNTKLFFKDKGVLFTSLITPLILLVLYVTFLGKIYTDSFKMSIPESFGISEKVINGCVGGQLFSSLLAVCCVTVAFCSNMIMVADKVNGAALDIAVSPVKRSTVSLAYYISTVISTLIVCYVAVIACFIYVATVGWYLSAVDVLLILLDIFILVMFGTALSSIINFFLSSQGQISAVGTIISAGYGFICGAYMPISQFAEGLQKVISFLPGTYGTSLIRNHAMRGTFAELSNAGAPDQVVDAIKDSVDCNIYLFDKAVPAVGMYAILVGAVVILIAAYVALNVFCGGKAKKN